MIKYLFLGIDGFLNTISYAILFEKDGEQFWFHVEKWFIEEKE